ncbi:hypothetical protein SKAU_G00041980 [Synaphobranchus kaupii]|uniref:EFCAB10 C-terminal EF-hand domain-containing protein n=1 Tax=Synaphobranchus kaupii TaxID=118154 RepID=A0A9Q1G262_SYNKA|nr:hypothetical protein SKAU_G00041980 [Synaphobranchus kaupii]
MATPREQEAANYLEKHKIPELMDNLTSTLFFHRPETPSEFLITQLELLKASRLQPLDCPCLIDESNLDAVFGILDPVKQGYITLTQYKLALATLGIKDFDECPEGAVLNRISQETFKKQAKDGLLKSSATFKT